MASNIGKPQVENQPENKSGLSGLEVAGITAFALAVLWLCGFPPNDATQWMNWLFHPWVLETFSPAKMLLLFFALIYYLLVNRYTRNVDDRIKEYSDLIKKFRKNPHQLNETSREESGQERHAVKPRAKNQRVANQ